MDPQVFIGAFLGALLSTVPAQAGVVCDRSGFCFAQPQFPPRFPMQIYPVQPPPPYYLNGEPPLRRGQKISPDWDPQPPKQDSLGARVKGEIYEFCSSHPEEQFCGDLNRYLQQHPEAK